MGAGILYLVSGPIGNMQDITFRAVQTLKEADLILSEDTRETAKVFDYFQIQKSQLSYRDQNHNAMLPEILSRMESGQKIVLMSDSGTPLISDPGFKLVREVIKAGHKVSPVPGPSAVITALSASGLPADRFTFLGFLPKSGVRREKLLKEYGDTDSTLVVYESPFRIKKLLEEINHTLGNRRVCLAGELTKVHEKIITEHVAELLNNYEKLVIKGEYVVLIEKING